MANDFSYLALSLWPLVSIVFFLTLRTVDAVFATMIIGWLLLPERVNLDLNYLPSFNKYSITALSACIVLALVKKKNILKFGGHKNIRYLAVGLFIIPFFVYLTNREPMFNGVRFIQGLSPRDVVSMLFEQLMYLLPFLLGLKCVVDKAIYLRVITLILLSAMVYAIPALIEVRLSPQFHTWVYGFFPHSFVQQMRFGGFRPVVFLSHGLDVAFFFSLAFLISLTYILYSSTSRKRNLFTFAPIVLLLLIFYSKTFAAYFVVLIGLPLLLIKNNQFKRLAATSILLISMLYPVAQLTGVFPSNLIVAGVEQINSDRAQSLSFRFYQEDQLKDRVLSKPLFGWGGWARNRFENSVTDSFWILVSGKLGLIGLLLYSFPIIYSIRRLIVLSKSRHLSVRDRSLCVNSALVVALYSIFLIPNYGINPLYLFFVGATIGFASSIERKKSIFMHKRIVEQA